MPKVEYTDKMDPECIALCDALNEIPKIATTESCCGHGKRNFLVFFTTDSFEALAEVCYYFHQCHSGVVDWKVIARTDCSMAANRFMIEGPIGDFKGAEQIAKVILHYLQIKEELAPLG